MTYASEANMRTADEQRHGGAVAQGSTQVSAQRALDASALEADPVQLYASDEAAVYHSRWQELAQIVDRCDALIVDAPYSERTHGAYRDMAEVNRRSLSYPSWSAGDVAEFVAAWAPRTSGWFVSLTDHILAPAWEAAFAEAGRYVFAPLACMEPGSRVRLSGDGPSQWSCLAVVARPKTREAQKWGALPGGYVVPAAAGWRGTAEAGGRSGVVGGKPLWLMERLVEDYSRPGQLVVDPCCGAGTTLKAALRTGRRCIGGDAMLEHAKLAARAVSGPTQRPLLVTAPSTGGAT
jgi:hypothetical protein